MATVIRKTNQLATTLGNAINDLKAYVVASNRLIKADLATATGAGTTFTAPGFHNDACERTITLTNAIDLPTSLALTNQIKAVYEFHRVDTLAHANADTTNTVAATPLSIDLASAITLANAIKVAYTAHRTQATVHATNDSTNTIVAANASDQTSLNTLVNELKTKLNAHMASAVAAKSVRVVPA